jgi:Flp pilus assembly pilin Flp
MVEYSLVILLVGIAVIVVLTALGGRLSPMFEAVRNTLVT